MPRIVRFHRFGGPDVLVLDELPSQDPGPGEVRIRVEAFALNRADQLYREQRHSVMNGPLPSRIGYEATGTVDALGPGVTQWRIGDRVSTLPQPSSAYGVHGEEALFPAAALVPVPYGFTAAEATSTWLQYMTAWGGLMAFGGCMAGDFVVVTAGSSGSAIGAIQMAKDAGARVVATTRTDEKAEFVRSIGADRVIVTERESLTAAVLDFTGGHGADVVYDCVGGSVIASLIDACAWRARYVLYGNLGGPSTIPLIPAALKEIAIRPYSMPTVFADAAQRAAGLAYIQARLDACAFRPVVGAEFDLKSIVEAHRFLESNRTRGKIVVNVRPVESRSETQPARRS
jgi:NADPH:quinone reductase-like Zn-dependent oxidoreductase